ncbi:hypothetical protein CLI64_06170 [Nostoc sp. CENA543]|uniref:hypothetical protein n=1 Tax=Nostoc sp. CENA543 TaxID=1869241 RepID=UPI000CA3B78C|nr:hypothetical protein [Nostoc sp. CENA543]AUT00003.1 hypothetical protein CLI64_06170 [Nostoc sp. CENA543]
MENSQSLQHELTQVNKTKAESKKRRFNFFMFLLTRHPLLLLIGLLATCLGSATLALHSLIHVSDVEQAESESVPSVVEVPVSANTDVSNPIPLWMVVAIAFSCASGCWVILRLTHQSKQPSTVANQRVATTRTSTVNRRQRIARRTVKPQPVLASAQPIRAIAPMSSRQTSVMKVLPPEQKHPLDRGKESLADLVDWRKHNSLSALLQKY